MIRLDSHLSAVRGAMKNGDWPRKRKEVDGVKMISQDEYEIIEDEESIKGRELLIQKDTTSSQSGNERNREEKERGEEKG